MTAAKLRDAATRLRELAEGATPGPWIHIFAGGMHHCVEVDDDADTDELTVGRGMSSGTATFIAAMDPTVALALADWLSEEAARADERSPYFFPLPCLAVADAILGITP